MPGPSRSVKNAGPANERLTFSCYGSATVGSGYSQWFYDNCQNLFTKSYYENLASSMALTTAPYGQAVLGIQYLTFGGLGGGPNEPGSNSHATTHDPVLGSPTVVTVPFGSNTTQINTHVNHWYPADAPQTWQYKQNYNQAGGAGILHYFGSFQALNGNPTITGSSTPGSVQVSPNAEGHRSAGGGGWGASGGSRYTSAVQFFFPSAIIAGGAGGPAVKTNGNAVTFTGGQGTDRMFGAIA